MKKIGLFVALLAVVLGSSCSEDFKVGAPYKNVMIVYGLLNRADTAQYIKITRGYFDEKGNNLLSAKNPDSIYHKNLSVQLEERNAAGTLVNTYTLSKVDLKAEGIIKDTGVFVSSPAYAYKLGPSTPLKNNFRYKLLITNPENGAVVSATTTVLSNASSDLKLENFVPGFSTLNFSGTAEKSTFTWTVPKESGSTELFLRFNYLEIENGVLETMKFADLPLATNLPVPANNNTMIIDYNNAGFLGDVKSGLKSAVGNIKRYVDTADLVLYAGGKELTKYITISNAQGGLTADQIKPIYTNLVSSNPDKEDVYGLFDTRVKVIIRNLPYSSATIDSLINSPFIQDVRIVGVSPR